MLGLALAFEWLGSFAFGRPVAEVLVSWNVFAGYMWPYVLPSYLFPSLIVGVVLRMDRKRRVAEIEA